MRRSGLVSALVISLCLTLISAQNPGSAAPNEKANPKAKPDKPASSPTSASAPTKTQPLKPAESEVSNSGQKSEGNNPNKNLDVKSEGNNPNKNVDVKSEPAKKSENQKVNPSNLAGSKINSNAQKMTKVSTIQSPSCQAKTPAEKTRLAQDPCSDFIVVFTPGLGKAQSQELIKQSNAQTKREFSSIFNGALVNGPLSKMQALARNPNVLVVEDDLEVTTTAIQNQAPWGLDRVDQTNLPLSTTFDDQNLIGLNTYSFVVDTGIDASNSDFQGRVAAGFTAINDGLGSKDCNGHGTHVAGIIGGAKYGAAKGTNLIPVRVLNCSGSGSYSSVIAGLDWISANYTTGMAAVVNMSLGGPVSSTIDGAVSTLISKGINVVVAAGNSNADACNFSPANVPGAITVGATETSDSRASYSNFGSCLDLFAPGSAITSTWLGATGVNTISGTSMAAPLVAAVVARFISNNSGLTPAQVANSIKSSSTKNVVLNAGSNSVNQLIYLSITPNLVIENPTTTTPVFKKVNPRGKKR